MGLIKIRQEDDWTSEAVRAENDDIHDGSPFFQFMEEFIPTPTGYTEMFEEHAKDIPKTTEEFYEWVKKYTEMPIVSDYIPKVIEFGCNIGKWLPSFFARGFEIHAIDQCEYALEVATKRYPHLKDNLYLGKIWDFDGKKEFENKFDLVFTIAVIQHNSHIQKEKILKTVKYFLKPGGYYFMTENTRPEENYDDGYSFDYPGWIKFFDESGFELVKYTKQLHLYLWKIKE